MQPITGDDADELVAEFRNDDRGSLFRLEGTGLQRSAVATSARGNEHQLEKVTMSLRPSAFGVSQSYCSHMVDRCVCGGRRFLQ